MPELTLWSRETVPLGKIIAIGRNYAKHAAEMQSPVPTEPVFFLKPASSYLADGGTVRKPERVKRLDPEVELAVVIGKTGHRIQESKWRDYVLGFAVALDMTARDLQDEAKKRGEPWTLSKSYDTFCPISTVIDAKRVNDPQQIELELKVNGEMRQKGSAKEMVFPLGKILAYVSEAMTLERGDVILTGTPEGVGPVKRGDVLEARLVGLVALKVKVDEEKTRG